MSIQSQPITFGPPAEVPFSSNLTPALSPYAGELSAVFVGTEHIAINTIDSSDGVNWGTASRVGTYQTGNRPALCNLPGTDLLICAFQGIGGGQHIYMTTYSNGQWGGLNNPMGVITSLGPSLAYWEAKNTLYCAFQAADATNSIRYISSQDGINWSPYPPLYVGQSTLDVPAFCGYGDALYCAYKDADNKTLKLVRSTDGAHWSDPVNLGETHSSPALCVSNGLLWCAFRSADDKIMFGQLPTDGSANWKYYNVQGITSQHGPALCNTPNYGGTNQLLLMYISDGPGSPMMQIVQEIEG